MTGDAKRYYPAFLDLSGRLVVVVGSGALAERRARQLARYGADVTIITPDPSDALVEAEGEGKVMVEARRYVRGDLTGSALVICADPDPEVQRAVFDEAVAVGCPVTVTGSPELSSFIIPSMVHREPLQIAVSTGGAAPHLAKRVRRELSERFGPAWGDYVLLVAKVRALAAERLEDPEELDRLVESVLDSDVLERLEAGERLIPSAVYERFAPPAASGGDS
jgi:precorrin-2 dehydrogenase/sirohydrochlorin ferrochelatase